jgi:hypothetical protein
MFYFCLVTCTWSFTPICHLFLSIVYVYILELLRFLKTSCSDVTIFHSLTQVEYKFIYCTHKTFVCFFFVTFLLYCLCKKKNSARGTCCSRYFYQHYINVLFHLCSNFGFANKNCMWRSKGTEINICDIYVFLSVMLFCK